MERIVSRTNDVGTAFIEDLLRRCAQFQIEFSRGNLLTQPAVDTAIEEMRFAGGALNRRLLGARAMRRFQAELLDAPASVPQPA